MALEFEIDRWQGFRRMLPSDKDRAAFDEMMDYARNSATAGGNACNPILFEPMVMSIVLGQLRKLMEIEYGMFELMWQEIDAKAKLGEKSKP
jgi:hypothetical protein